MLGDEDPFLSSVGVSSILLGISGVKEISFISSLAKKQKTKQKQTNCHMRPQRPIQIRHIWHAALKKNLTLRAKYRHMRRSLSYYWLIQQAVLYPSNEYFILPSRWTEATRRRAKPACGWKVTVICELYECVSSYFPQCKYAPGILPRKDTVRQGRKFVYSSCK